MTEFRLEATSQSPWLAKRVAHFLNHELPPSGATAACDDEFARTVYGTATLAAAQPSPIAAARRRQQFQPARLGIQQQGSAAGRSTLPGLLRVLLAGAEKPLRGVALGAMAVRPMCKCACC